MSQNLETSRVKHAIWTLDKACRTSAHEVLSVEIKAYHHCAVCLAITVLGVVHAGLEGCQKLLHCSHNSKLTALGMLCLLKFHLHLKFKCRNKAVFTEGSPAG